ncbi:MAG: ABC transporter substrate-binding protein [Actinobacteria bacterium]|nr:ABC transporter substrate-binding protein [Actinomycetota bacterium]
MKMGLGRFRFGAVAAVLALVAAIVVAGCGGGGTSSGGGGATGAGANGAGSSETVSGGEGEAQAKPGGTLTLADFDEPISLNPFMVADILSSHAVTQMFEPLFKADVEGKLEPWLAESMKASPDRKTFTVTLRKGVKFSNGKPMTSADVAFSLETIRKSPVWGIMFELVESVKATGPDTVVIKTSKPAAKLEGQLSLPFAAIVPKNFGGESEEEFAAHPIGTGPFAYASWKRGESLTFDKNKYYWKPGLPLLEKVVFEMVPDVNSRDSQLRAGELDVVASPDWSQLPAMEAEPNLHVGIYKASILDSLGLNMKEPLFQNDKVREAINLAIDREGIVKAALFGHGETAGSWLMPGLEFHDETIKAPAQDVAKAKKLLAEAVKEGVEPTLQISLLKGQTFTTTVAQIIQSNLVEAGFSVSLRPLDESAMNSVLPAGKYDAALGLLASNIVDPSELASFYPATEALYTFGSNATKVAKLEAEAVSAPSEKIRGQRYAEIQEAVEEEKALVTLDYRPFVWAMQGNVTGFQVGVTSDPWLGETGFTE